MSDCLKCPICLNGFQPGQWIVCCIHDTRHNVHELCQKGTTCSLCRREGMHRNTCLEALFEQGTVPSEEHELSFIGYSAIEGGKGTYKGEWKDNLFHGKGILRWPNGLVEECEFRKGKQHGLSKITFRDGTVANVHYHEGKRHGLSTYTYTDGSVLDKMYHKQTKAVLSVKNTWTDGTVLEAHSHEGKLHGMCKATYPNGHMIEQTYYRGTLHGLYKKTTPINVIEATYIDGKRQGRGTITWPDGTVVTMNYSDDKVHGKWKKVFANGKVEYRTYHEGRLHKPVEAPAAHVSSSKSPVLGKRGREDDLTNQRAKASRV